VLKNRKDKNLVKVSCVFGGDYYGDNQDQIIASKELKSIHKRGSINLEVDSFPYSLHSFFDEIKNSIIRESPSKFHVQFATFDAENYNDIFNGVQYNYMTQFNDYKLI
jgi:dipeptidase